MEIYLVNKNVSLRGWLDFNECEAKHDLCGNMTTCENTIGGYSCICANGKKHDWSKGYVGICEGQHLAREIHSSKEPLILDSEVSLLILMFLILILLITILMPAILWWRMKRAKRPTSQDSSGSTPEIEVSTQYGWNTLTETHDIGQHQFPALPECTELDVYENDEMEIYDWNETTGSHTSEIPALEQVGNGGLNRPLLNRPATPFRSSIYSIF